MQTLTAYKWKVKGLSFSADGATLASAGGKARAISLWDLSRGKRSYLRGHTEPLEWVRFAPQASYLLSGDRYASGRLWSVDADSAWTSTVLPTSVAAFVGEGHEVACARWDTRSRWSVFLIPCDEPGPPPPALPLLEPDLRRLSLFGSPSGRDLAAIGEDWRIRIPLVLLIRPGPELVGLRLRPFSTPHDVTFSPDGRTLAVAATEAILRWTVATVEPLPPLRGHTRMINAAAYLPDGRLLSCSNDGTTRLWDCTSGKCLDVRDWQLGELTALAVARDGMRAAVGSKTGTILIWDLD
jgi:WD40 repeat protein